MNKYESVFITRQDYSTQQVESLNERITDMIKNLGGKVVKKEYWGLRSLAYRIKKNRKGHYVLLQIEGNKELVKEYNRQMLLNEDITRQITLKVEEFEEEKSAILRNRDEQPVRSNRQVNTRTIK